MKILWYLLTLVFGAIGVVSGLRTVELLMTSARFLPTQLLIALVMLLLAVLCLRKARTVT